MKKVLLAAPVPPPYGGISHWTAMVVRHSQGEGRIPLKVVDTAIRDRSIFDQSLTKRILRGIPHFLKQFFQVVRGLSGKNILALHVTTSAQYSLIRDIAFLSIAKIYRRISVYHVRSGRIPALLRSNGVQPYLLRLGLRTASHVIAIDESTARAIRGSLPRVSVSTVPNCIDVSILPDCTARKAQTILFVGWVIPAKGIEELLGAWAKISRPDWSLKIIGPCSSEYASDLAERHDLQSVEFVGECDNSMVLVEMARAAVLCLPSYTEGFPNVILEAMALRCAIVATPVGAIPEMLADGAGVIVNERDHIALADQLRALMDDPAARERLVGRANAKIKKEYAIGRVYERYEAIWRGERIA